MNTALPAYDRAHVEATLRTLPRLRGPRQERRPAGVPVLFVGVHPRGKRADVVVRVKDGRIRGAVRYRLKWLLLQMRCEEFTFTSDLIRLTRAPADEAEKYAEAFRLVLAGAPFPEWVRLTMQAPGLMTGETLSPESES